jgi:hypothetical protein
MSLPASGLSLISQINRMRAVYSFHALAALLFAQVNSMCVCGTHFYKA